MGQLHRKERIIITGSGLYSICRKSRADNLSKRNMDSSLSLFNFSVIRWIGKSWWIYHCIYIPIVIATFIIVWMATHSIIAMMITLLCLFAFEACVVWFMRMVRPTPPIQEVSVQEDPSEDGESRKITTVKYGSTSKNYLSLFLFSLQWCTIAEKCKLNCSRHVGNGVMQLRVKINFFPYPTLRIIVSKSGPTFLWTNFITFTKS